MKLKSCLSIFLMSILLFDASAAGISLKAKKTRETKVEPVSIEKISAVAEGENGESKELEGLGFIFEITKLKKNDKKLYIQELRDFKIDGKSYAAFTSENLGLKIEPQTVLVDSSKFIEQNPYKKNIVKNKKSGIIMQTAIYGAELPSSGKVSVTAQIGWAGLNEEQTDGVDGKIEDFVFEFELSSLKKSENNSGISKNEKKELLKQINDFKKDKDLSLENLKKYSYIIDFASKNETVKISIDSSCLPKEIISSEYAPLFVLAYVCGNLEKQLVSGNYENSPKEGIDFERLKYRQLKETNSEINFPFLEDAQ
ncbi:hypothetical protein [Treponema zioleckii]|uniref:hypothetical protein n=1 Tax=Treponema zioleckii TaxID=331680 RepID=UPI00168B717A|nr:hypothetical protein [Treponema zioleckii]